MRLCLKKEKMLSTVSIRQRWCVWACQFPAGFSIAEHCRSWSPKLATTISHCPQLLNGLLLSTTKGTQETGNFPPALRSVTQIHLQALGAVLQSGPALHLLSLWLIQAVGISSSHQAVTVLRISDGSSPSNRLFQATCPYKQTKKNLHSALTLVLVRCFFDKIHPNNLPHLSAPEKGRMQTQCYSDHWYWGRWGFVLFVLLVCLFVLATLGDLPRAWYASFSLICTEI